MSRWWRPVPSHSSGEFGRNVDRAVAELATWPSAQQPTWVLIDGTVYYKTGLKPKGDEPEAVLR